MLLARAPAAWLLTLASPALAATFAGVEVPAPPPPAVVTETHWGTKVEDPYRFLENVSDPQVQGFMRAQAEATDALLAKIPGRAALLERIREIDAGSSALVTSVQRDARGGVFFLKREPKDEQLKLYRRGPDGTEQLLVDPEVESKATGKAHAISAFAPSPDGRLVAYNISASGTEIGTLRVIDVATGKEVTAPIDRVRFSACQWLLDGSGFFYLRLAEGYDKRPRADRFLDRMSWLRVLAQPERDRAVFGAGLDPATPVDRFTTAYPVEVPGQGLVAAHVYHGVDRNRSLYVSPLAEVIAGKPRWRKVFDPSDRVHEATFGGGFLYVRSAKDAPRFRVLRTKLPAADLAQAEVVVPAGEGVVVDIAAARDTLYVTRRDGAVTRLWRAAHVMAPQLEQVRLPVEGNVELADVRPLLDGAVLRLGGWTRANRHYATRNAASAPVDLGLAKVGAFDAPSGLVAREVKVKSHDGVEVPMSIIARADIRLDGTSPALLYGYGSYGSVEEPSWNPRLLAWLERGGVYAIAHVRGGGIHGEAWALAGRKATKPNTWKDGIAAGQWLVDWGYTRPGRLSIYGGSAGGIFTGRAVTEKPELFSAAVIAVGSLDMLRAESMANGAANIPEFGTLAREDEFRALLAMSTYEHIKPGTRYPALLFEHGVNDIRVDVWTTLKAGSRFAAASASGKPVLMNLDFDAGHGSGATRAQVQKRLADRWSFLLWQAGAEGFQPR